MTSPHPNPPPFSTRPGDPVRFLVTVTANCNHGDREPINPGGGGE
ncbi:hypothetical protein ABZW32_35615 [Streptomyces sp. NPDC004667]